VSDEPTYEVRFRAEVVLRAEHELLTRDQQREVIRRLEASPEHGKPLTGQLRGCFRHRVGDIRVVYEIDRAAKVVVIVAIGRRRDSEVYGTAGKRQRPATRR
jgi:mRNA-degrading endonuclease RelE of RelBE toxin-antitoxin system